MENEMSKRAYSEIFEKSPAYMLSNEGIYSNDAADKGGETIYGITRRA